MIRLAALVAKLLHLNQVAKLALPLVVTVIALFSIPTYAQITSISSVSVESLKIEGDNVYVKGTNIPSDGTCISDSLSFSLDESQDPGGAAFYSVLLTGRSLGDTFTISYELLTGGICVIRGITVT